MPRSLRTASSVSGPPSMQRPRTATWMSGHGSLTVDDRAAIDPNLAGETLYVWPDSLIAPIALSEIALAKKGLDPAIYTQYWRDARSATHVVPGTGQHILLRAHAGAIWVGKAG